MGRRTKSVALAAMLLLIPLRSEAIASQHILAPASDKGTEESELLTAVRQAPGNAQLVGALGEFYAHKNQWRESIPWLAKAYALSADNQVVGYDLAFALTQAGDLENAKQKIDQMLLLTDSSKLHNLLGSIAERRGKVLEAAKQYHRAAELEPTEVNIFDLATFLVQQKGYVGFVDESIKFFRYGVQKFPRSSQMMVGLGVALYAADQYDEGVRVLCAAVDLDPTDRRAIGFLGKARKVSPALSEEVDRRLQDFAERYPKNAATNYYYALALWERGGGGESNNPDKIEEMLKIAESQAPGWYEPHYQLGMLLESEKRYGEAIKEMQAAAKIVPDFSPAHFRLAMLYNRTGDKAKALKESSLVRQIKNKGLKDAMTGDAEK